ncbi:MAG: aldehyde dehydrogenase [Chlorobi bacterium]|nr:aldehyde dehydrogenase [Chlorobiota bacterium]
MKQVLGNINEIINAQKLFFKRGKTQEVKFRVSALKILRNTILQNEDKLYEALWNDLHKTKIESFSTEIGLVLKEIDYTIKNLKKWTKPKRISNSLIHFKSKSYIYSQPYGRVLIIAPWNYPFLLLINPLIGAIAGGNCIILKPSPYSANTAKVMNEMINSVFKPNFIAVLLGGREMNSALLNEKFDYIFFTGSKYLGKIVMKSAADNLTPVTLELGGKSPCIVDKDANIPLSAKRIIWGKFLNAGQTCIAPDYILVAKEKETELLSELKRHIIIRWGDNPIINDEYPRIINNQNCEKLVGLTKNANIYYGGDYNVEKRYFSPTILQKVKNDDSVMREEIFGPILPVLTYDDLDDAYEFINKRPKPLAFYFFSKNRRKQKQAIKKTIAGGSCINDTIMHIASNKLPFGGVGESGMGNYHGKYSFDTFTHKRSVIYKALWIDIPIRYNKDKFSFWIIKKLFKR